MPDGRMTEDPLDGAYPPKKNLGSSNRKMLKRKMRAHKKGARQTSKSQTTEFTNFACDDKVSQSD